MRVDEEVASCLAEKMRSLDLKVSSFDDPRLYPPRNLDLELQLNYFIFMCSIDHRTGAGFGGLVQGEWFRGSELLWRLGKAKLDEDPSFFTVDHMSRVSCDTVVSWLSVKEPRETVIKGPRLRTELLRDTAKWLARMFEGDPRRLIELSEESCVRLIELLRPFKAFNDPVAKKAYLLVKFLERRGLFKVRDEENLEVPVDNHLTRVALRLGLVEVNSPRAIGGRVGLGFDVKLRLTVRLGYKLVARRAGLRPTYLDDLLWSLGRELCLRKKPRCTASSTLLALGGVEGCPFKECCRGFKDENRRKLKEPVVNTWWY
ncbi:MAG: hypothetical protein DRJ97_03910 [Thermoprotei archaeon]|nr:MAG: hypothetical protein DRJ97_03910 [Thermoprotei archaeon]